MNAARVVDRPDPFVVPQALNRLRRSGFALSVEGGKLIVAPGSRLTDADRTFLRAHKPALVALLEDPPASPAPVIDWEAFEERAAIMEYDGGLTREEAERKALAALGLTASPASPTPDASANLNRPSLAPPIADPNLDRALGVLNTLYRQHVARLAAGGHGPRGAMVHRSDYFKALRKARMATDTAFELLDQGQVETDSDGLYWVPIHQEAAP